MDAQLFIGIATLLTSVGTIAAVIVALKAVNVAKKSFVADHLRRKQQATIEYYNELSNNITVPLRNEISVALGETHYQISYTPIMPDSQIWKENRDLQIKVVKYCRNMERFAVGIKLGVFDFDTFYYIAGQSTAELFEQIHNLVNNTIITNRHKAQFCTEYVNLCEKLIKRYHTESSEDKISKNSLNNLTK